MDTFSTKYAGKHDPVSHPRHYNMHPSGVEVIELTREMPFGPGNAVKYILRRNLKDSLIENIRKAEFYLADSLNEGIMYQPNRRLVNKALLVVRHDPNHLVRSFISTLCIEGADTSEDRTDYYLDALNLCGLMKETYI